MSTLRQKADASDEAPSVRVLTILCHPDLSRVGERARLDELADRSPVLLSRLEPHFAPSGGGAARPLADPYLSRQPLEIAVASAGKLRLTPSDVDGGDIEIDGQRLAAPLTVTDDPGTVLQLTRRVALLLHRERLQRRHGPDLGLIGESDKLESVRRRVLDIAPSTISVLIRGESGTGKDLAARAIHAASACAAGPFVAVNMGTLTSALAASELFGHVRGAFTDAREPKLGYFARADGGTLFLDEVGKTPVDVQAALLRAIETREIQPVGADRPRRVDVRILSATDSNLEQSIVSGQFAEALFHRLAAYEIRMPPLRERIDDVGRLLMHFLRGSLTSLGSLQRLEPAGADGVPWLPASLVAKLARYPWPGNVRELRNAVTDMAVSSHREPRARIGDELGRKIASALSVRAAREPQHAAVRGGADAVRPSEITEQRLLAALQENAWNLVRAAAELAISRTTLYGLIERYGLRKGINIPAAEILRCRDECGGDLDLMAQRLRVSKRALALRLAQIA